MPVTADLGVGAYCGVPVLLPDGSLYGTLCGLDGDARPDLTADQVMVLSVIASLLGQQLAELGAEKQAAAAERTELLELLHGSRLAIVGQPIVDVRTGTRPGFEALSRFTDRAGQPCRPDVVFAEATRLALGPTFELAAVTAALEFLPRLPDTAYLSVNLSAATLCTQQCQEVLAPAPLPRLVLELTEHEAVQDYGQLAGAMAELRRAGLRLAVDDVGAGFSSLQHILRLNPDVIKLDISLTRTIGADPARRALAAGFAGLARELGSALVAEGVETEQERDTLLALDVYLMQGFLLGRPAPIDAPDRR